MRKNSKIFIAGHKGLLGSAIKRLLERRKFNNLILRTRGELDLADEIRVNNFFRKEKPEYVFLAAAKVGSIAANIKYPADFLLENIKIQTNIIDAAKEQGAKKLIFFGSNCFYPRECRQPIKEEYLMTGPIEPTNLSYGIAKLAGLEVCRSYNKQHGTNFIVAVPASIYGPGDHFDLDKSHVVSSLIIKFHEAKIRGDKEVVLWGDGTPRREFIYCDDVADASIFLMNTFDPNPKQIESGDVYVNIGTGVDYTILKLANEIKKLIGYRGQIVWDKSKSNGIPRKLLDSSKFRKLGWQPKVGLEEGLKKTYVWFLKNKA